MWLCSSPGTGKITYFTSDFTSGDPHHGISRHIFWHIFYLTFLLTFYLAFYLTFYLTLYVTSCIEGSDWDLPLAVEARQCLLSSGARLWGPAVPTAIWRLQLTRRRAKEAGRPALIKSRDPHRAASPGWGTKTESLSGCFSEVETMVQSTWTWLPKGPKGRMKIVQMASYLEVCPGRKVLDTPSLAAPSPGVMSPEEWSATGPWPFYSNHWDGWKRTFLTGYNSQFPNRVQSSASWPVVLPGLLTKYSILAPSLLCICITPGSILSPFNYISLQFLGWHPINNLRLWAPILIKRLALVISPRASTTDVKHQVPLISHPARKVFWSQSIPVKVTVVVSLCFITIHYPIGWRLCMLGCRI